MMMVLFVILGDCLISEGETDDDDGIIAIADVEVGWIGRVKIGETTHIMMLESVDLIDISVSVGWANADVEVSWTAFSAVCSGLAQSKYLKMFWCFLWLIVDIFAIKLLYFFILMDSFTDSSYSIYYYDRTCLWYERINTWTFTKFI